MRLILFSLLSVILPLSAAQAQSVMDNIPQSAPQMAPAVAPAVTTPPPAVLATPSVAPNPAPSAAAAANTDPYTVMDVAADVTADTASHARDQALIQAEHAAYVQLCARLSIPDSVAKISDDALASLVQSFDVQSEKTSAVRYIGVFTIRFKMAALQKKFGHLIGGPPEAGAGLPNDEAARSAALASASHMTIAVQTPSLPAWTQTKKRLASIPQVIVVETLDLGRGVSHIDLRYSGMLDELQSNLTAQGLILRQEMNGEWELVDTAVQ